MKPELRKKILEYNRAVAAQKEKAEDLDIIVKAIAALPPGQQDKFLSGEVMAVLEKHITKQAVSHAGD